VAAAQAIIMMVMDQHGEDRDYTRFLRITLGGSGCTVIEQETKTNQLQPVSIKTHTLRQSTTRLFENGCRTFRLISIDEH
jgi:hypothetical protein